MAYVLTERATPFPECECCCRRGEERSGCAICGGNHLFISSRWRQRRRRRRTSAFCSFLLLYETLIANSIRGIPYMTSLEEGMNYSTMLRFSPHIINFGRRGSKDKKSCRLHILKNPNLWTKTVRVWAGAPDVLRVAVYLAVVESRRRTVGRTARFDLLKGQRCCQIPGWE